MSRAKGSRKNKFPVVGFIVPLPGGGGFRARVWVRFGCDD